MTVTPQAIQAILDSAVAELAKTTSGYATMVKQHGTDWTMWPSTSHWYIALTTIAAARAELAPPLAADFTLKEV